MSEKYLNDELLLNARKPVGKLGNELIDHMNENHEGLARWGVSHLDVSKGDMILDIGCGGGVNVERFLKLTENMVFGLDYSSVAIERSTKLNESSIDEGKCEIIQGSVSDLPFEQDTFDIVTAFETVYFWPDFLNDLKEVRRVLKDSGTILIANEALPDKYDARQKHIIELLDMNIYSASELDEHLNNAGFCDVKIHIRKSKDSFTGDGADWICAVAKKQI